jgi:hypothetical protein
MRIQKLLTSQLSIGNRTYKCLMDRQFTVATAVFSRVQVDDARSGAHTPFFCWSIYSVVQCVGQCVVQCCAVSFGARGSSNNNGPEMKQMKIKRV